MTAEHYVADDLARPVAMADLSRRLSRPEAYGIGEAPGLDTQTGGAEEVGNSLVTPEFNCSLLNA